MFILLGFLICVVIYFIYHRFQYFAKRSIPSPPIPSIVFGHLKDLWSAKSYSEQLRQWTREYGSIYGLFEGIRPVYVISDIKLIEEIFVTQFSRFYSRRITLANRILGKENFNVLSANISSLWKKQRKILSPTFSAVKMKRLLPTVQTCINVFIDRLALTPKDTVINIYEIYKRLTMDVICMLDMNDEKSMEFCLSRSKCI